MTYTNCRESRSGTLSFDLTAFLMLLTLCLLSGRFAYTVEEPVVISVTGSITDGGTLVVSGSGFGVHEDHGGIDPYLNYLFEDCDAGFISGEKWTSGRGRATDADQRLGSSYSVFHERRLALETYTTIFGETITHDIRLSLGANVTDVADVHNYFLSQWIRLSDDFENISESNDNQIKILMTTPDGVGGKDYFQTRGNPFLAGGYPEPPLRTETESGELSIAHGPITDYMPYGTWHRMDMWVSIPDATTGFVDQIKWWVDGLLIRTTKQTDGHLYPDFEDINNVGEVSFIGYMKNFSDASFSVQTDDHYLDFSMARVEISDSPVWDDTVQAQKEIQLPQSWTDSTISLEANMSAFSDNIALYLYVVNANGEVNVSGFQIRAESYPISYNANGAETGTVPASQAKFEGTDLTLSENTGGLGRLGFVFDGWNTAADGSGTDYTAGGIYTVDTLLALFVKWTPVPTYSVTFDEGDYGLRTGGGALVQIVNEATDATEPIISPDTGWTFTGWDIAFINVTSDLTVTAQYTQDFETVTYDANTAETGTAPASQAKILGQDLTLSANTGELGKLGFVFAGWNTAADGSGVDYAEGDSYTTEAPLALFVKWTSVPIYTVTFVDGDNGSITGGELAQEVNEGDDAAEPVITSDVGWTFTGWDTAFSNVTSDLTVTALYTVTAYQVLYDSNSNGSISGPSSQTVLYGADAATVTAVADAGYVFSDWSDGVLTATRSDIYVTGEIDVTADFVAVSSDDDTDDTNGGCAMGASSIMGWFLLFITLFGVAIARRKGE